MTKRRLKTIYIIVMFTVLTAYCLSNLEYFVDAAWSGQIYIKEDGEIEPASAPIKAVNNHLYIILSDIQSEADGIIVKRSNIVINGGGHTLKGTKKQYSTGIKIIKCSNVTIENITVDSFYYGISLTSSSNNTVTSSHIKNNWIGILIMGSDNTISRNNITNNNYGIKTHGTMNYIYKNRIISNLPIGIWLYKTHNNTVEENAVINNSEGIKMYLSSYNQIIGNLVSNNDQGIKMELSHHNFIVNNTLDMNTNGFRLINSTYNLFKDNVIANSTKYGGLIEQSSYNELIHNDFINNKDQVKVLNSKNTWDAGYPEGGNYWSSHENIDEKRGPKQDQRGADGVVDKPYIIDEQNIDHYPLASPLWSNPPAINKQINIPSQEENTYILILIIGIVTITLSILYLYLHKQMQK